MEPETGIESPRGLPPGRPLPADVVFDELRCIENKRMEPETGIEPTTR